MLIYNSKLRFLGHFCLVSPASPRFFNGLLKRAYSSKGRGAYAKRGTDARIEASGLIGGRQLLIRPMAAGFNKRISASAPRLIWAEIGSVPEAG
jgi:hypothetical protein